MPAAVRRPVLSQSYPNYMPPMAPDGYQPITYYNDTLDQDVGVLYNPITGDVKSDGSSVSDMLAHPDMAKYFADDARKSVEQNYVSNMTPALQRPDALDMAQTSKPAPNMRADALDLPQTSKNFDLRENVPVLYNNPEENDFGQLDKVEEAPLLADFTSPMPTGARLDPYMNVPKNYHRMPDGTLMPDSEMKEALENPYDETSPVSKEALGDPYDETPPVLREALGDPYDETFKTGASDGVLGNNNDPKATPKAILDTTSSGDRKGSAVSANARGSMMPFAKINRNEALMRIGGAMVGGSSQGFSGAMKAATDEFGNIQDANRQAETDAFNKAEATRLAEARIQSQKDKAKANKKAMGMPSAVYKQAALTAITDIKGRLANESAFNPFDNNTGLFGYAMSHVAGTDAHDTANAIDTIEASIGFDRLQKMRDDSPTGGALGQVSNIELALLRKSLGSLKQSSSRAQFIKNLNSIETQYKKAVAAVEAQQREWYRMQGVDVPEPKNNSAEPAVVGGYSIVTKQK